MGVPKFFRYISERYPCLSEIVREYQLPEFDNMYLDMNGIIHMCSHPDDNNPHFRITEEKIFQDIFHYLEVLFRMIRPKKLFFMAIDGVAPRAKMNQQRGRRFRSAKDAEKQEEDAKKKGETLPTEARFDSNCITPGTVFMARLHEQLKYFVVDKISNDPLWRNVKVILSGHETPGEGEHKIMDYIRFLRSQPGYDPNTRHCLYGLDADLIMLGLCTHEPHFSLLREEVKFGKKSTKRQSVPEEITFFLLHLSLMREYLELEFAPVKDKLVGFKYDFEKIIDDWVLMGFLVGNDFIPHLPNLHIANGALPILYKAYMEVLPTLDGYINEGGTLNLARFEKFMQRLSNFDLENFEEIRDDLLYMEAKTGRKYNSHSKVSSGRDLEEWVPDETEDGVVLESIEPEKDKPKGVDAGLAALIKEADEMCLDSDDDEDEEGDEEDMAFENYKKEYYQNKLEYAQVTPGVMRDQAEGYVRAIQWNLNYYYNGVCSWSWFYPHHYAPYISDIKNFSDFKIDFDYGAPFKPYEQLLGVLPAASKNLLPEVYHPLMTSEDSPIKKYYPEEFQTDLNGKRQEWEAVVLIPFMDEIELLDAMRPCNERLTAEEKRRNSHGPMLACTYTDQDFGKYEAPDHFDIVKHNHCKVELITMESLRIPQEKLVKGAYPGAKMDVYYPGFPTMKHLKYKADLQKAKVKVFEQPSRYENMIIKIIPEEKEREDEVPRELLGTNIFVGWPHLLEAKVVAISNKKEKYISVGEMNQYNVEPIEDKTRFKDEYAGVVERYKNRLGVEVGEVHVVCHVQVLIGRKYIFAPNGRLTLEKQFSENTANYPLQTVVYNIEAHDSSTSLYRNISEIFPEGASCFILCNPYYGSQGLVLDSRETLKSGRIKVLVSVTDEPNFEKVRALKEEVIRSYKTLFNAASALGMSHFLYSRITGSIYVSIPDGEGGLKNVNFGLDLKFNKKNKETPGYTRKIATTWYYTNKCTELVRDYSEKFPEVFQYFSENASNDNISAEAIFGDKWDEKIKEVQTWLRSIPTHSLERQPCGSQVTEPEIVEEVEKIVDELPMISGSKKLTMQIKPAFLYKPEIQSGTLVPDSKVNVNVLDRIVNTRKGFSVPFGLKGTIIAITEAPSKNDRDTMYDVVFDKPFKDGMQLNCSPGRGYRLPKTSFINISFGKRLLEKKTGKQGSLVAMAESAQKPQNKWQNTNGQKFFDQFMQSNTPSQQTQTHKHYQTAYKQTQDQQTQPQFVVPQFNQPQYVPHGSAFASFNNQPRQFHHSPVEKASLEAVTDSTVAGIQSYMQPKLTKKEKQKEESSKSDDTGPMLITSSKLKNLKKTEPPPKKEVLAERPLIVIKSRLNELEMPFAMVTKGNKIDERPSGVVLKSNKTERPVVNTDYLKNLLKIGSDPVVQKKSSNVDDKLSPPTRLQKDSTETSSNVSFEMLAREVAKTPASVRLLTYYQSNGLGIPRYQYYESDKKYKAQITLTNGTLVLGNGSDTKEEATENVASEVLELLIKKAKTTDSISIDPSDSLPIPPKTWVEPQRDQALKAALHNPFVPTQVIKRQKSKSNNVSNQEYSADKNELHLLNDPGQRSQEVAAKSPNNDENKIEKTKLANSPKKQRKPRIAANFGVKK